MIRAITAGLLSLTLASCSWLPGNQTLGMERDPDASKKSLILAMGFVVDAIGVYGHLCAPVKTPACNSPKSYTDAKLIASAIAFDAQLVAAGRRSPIAEALVLGLVQYQLVKTIAAQPGPTNPQAPPDKAALAYVDSIAAADLLIDTADQRVQDALSVNTPVGDLVAELRQKVSNLP